MNKSTLLNAVVIVAVAFFIGWCSRSPSVQEWRAKYGLYRDSVNVVIQQAAASRKIIDSAVAAAKRDSILAAQWQARANRLNNTLTILHAANDSLKRAIPADLAACDSVEICANMHKLVSGLDAEVDSLRQQNTQLASSYASQVQASGKLQEALTEATHRFERDEAALAKLPPPPPQEKLLFIPLPSRTASFFLGAGITAAGALVLSHVHP